jgi:transketolase
MTSLRKVFAALLLDNGNLDQDLIVLVGDISHGLLSNFRFKFPKRYFNIGICEPAMVGLAAGLRIAGFNPVVHTIAPFLIERSYEQIKLDFGYQGLGGNFVSVGGSFDYSKLGCSHHTYSDVSMMAQLPNSNIFIPGSGTEFTKLFNQNYRNNEINYFRLTENPHGHEFSPENISSGEAILVKEGIDVTIAALGPMLKVALESSIKLAEQGIDAEVLYYHTFKPFDKQAVIKSVKKTKRIATIEELASIGGLNSIVLESCAEILLKLNLKFAVNNFVRSYGNYSDMLIEAGLSTEHIVKVITKEIKK